MQTAMINDIMELHQFNKIKVAQKSKDSQVRQMTGTTGLQHPCRYCGGVHMP